MSRPDRVCPHSLMRIWVYTQRRNSAGRAMKSHWRLIVFSALIIGFCGVVVGPAIWYRFHTLYPTPETESAFLKNYSPKSVIEQFMEPNWFSANGQNSGSGAGREFVTHTGGFDWHFAMRSEKWTPLMNALRNDASAQLQANGAKILHQSGDARDGFHFEYKLDKSVGTLTILPLTIDSGINDALPEGTVDVLARIEQTEKWFPKEPGMITAKISDSKP